VNNFLSLTKKHSPLVGIGVSAAFKNCISINIIKLFVSNKYFKLIYCFFFHNNNMDMHMNREETVNSYKLDSSSNLDFRNPKSTKRLIEQPDQPIRPCAIYL